MDEEEASVINDSVSVVLDNLSRQTIYPLVTYRLPGPSPRAPSLVCVRLIKGLCMEADGQKREKAEGKKAVTGKKTTKLQNLLLKYSFGRKARNIS